MPGRRGATAVDLLEGETKLLLMAFAEWDASSADRYCHDTIAKFILEQLVVREAARAAVVAALGDMSDTTLDAFVHGDRRPIRKALCRLSEMAEGTSAGELDFGQDFEGEVTSVRDLVTSELEAEPLSALLSAGRIALDVRSARYVRHHAPSRLRPEPKRWERYGPLVRFRSFYDRVRRAPHPSPARLPERLRDAERALAS